MTTGIYSRRLSFRGARYYNRANMPTDKNETLKAVLLDTEVFEAYGKDFERPDFAALKNRVDQDRAKVFITSVSREKDHQVK